MGDERTKANIAELERRGYKMFIDQDVNENFWKKGERIVSIHTVRSSPSEYFLSILNKKEEFVFEVL
jgi:hypothetical protein